MTSLNFAGKCSDETCCQANEPASQCRCHVSERLRQIEHAGMIALSFKHRWFNLFNDWFAMSFNRDWSIRAVIWRGRWVKGGEDWNIIRDVGPDNDLRMTDDECRVLYVQALGCGLGLSRADRASAQVDFIRAEKASMKWARNEAR